MIALNIPETANRAVLIVRHTESVQDGPQATRTITIEGDKNGQRLCSSVSPFYQDLVALLAGKFGAPAYYASQLIRAILTLWEVLHPAQLLQDSRLNLAAALKDLQGGDWLKARKVEGKKVPAIVQEFATSGVWKGTPFENGKTNYLDFVRNSEGALVIAFAHETAISLAAMDYLPTTELGLPECFGVLFYLNGSDIVGAQLVEPELVPKRDTWPL